MSNLISKIFISNLTFKKPHNLAITIFSIFLVLDILLEATKTPQIYSILITIFTIYFFGRRYAFLYKKEMSHNFKLLACIYYLFGQFLLLGAIVGWNKEILLEKLLASVITNLSINPEINPEITPSFAIALLTWLVVAKILNCALIYWLLEKGCKDFLKK